LGEAWATARRISRLQSAARQSLDAFAAALPRSTVAEHPNWRRKLPLALEEWERDPRFKRLSQRLAWLRMEVRA